MNTPPRPPAAIHAQATRLWLRLIGTIDARLLAPKIKKDRFNAAVRYLQKEKRRFVSQKSIASDAAERGVAGLQQPNISSWLNRGKPELADDQVAFIAERLEVEPGWLAMGNQENAPDHAYTVHLKDRAAFGAISAAMSSVTPEEPLSRHLLSSYSHDDFAVWLEKFAPSWMIRTITEDQLSSLIMKTKHPSPVELSFEERRVLMIALRAMWPQVDQKASHVVHSLLTKLGALYLTSRRVPLVGEEREFAIPVHQELEDPTLEDLAARAAAMSRRGKTKRVVKARTKKKAGKRTRTRRR